MATNYRNITTREDVEFIGGTQTRNVIAVSAYTVPNGTYFEFRVPRNLFDPTAVDAGALSNATIYELIWKQPYVVDVEWSQLPTAGGYLADNVTVTVSSTSGNSTASFTVLLTNIGPDLEAAKINTLHEQLDTIESS